MRGRPGPGALIGLVVGVVLVAVVIWLPAAVSGDFYEFTDPLVFMGLPMISISTAVGAFIGVRAAPVSGDGLPGQAKSSSTASRAVVAIVAVSVVLLATYFFLWATGAI